MDRLPIPNFLGFPNGSDDKESPCSIGDLDSIPGLRRSPRGGYGNPLQFLPGESPWTEEAGRLQSIWISQIQTQLSD